MKLRGLAMLALALSAQGLFGATAIGPVVNNGTINYQKNEVTLNGSGFVPARVAPVVRLNGAALVMDSFSNAQIVATLPAKTPAGTYTLTVVNSEEWFQRSVPGPDLWCKSRDRKGLLGQIVAGWRGHKAPRERTGYRERRGHQEYKDPWGQRDQRGLRECCRIRETA